MEKKKKICMHRHNRMDCTENKVEYLMAIN
jgi:hypothetical protein